MFGRGARHGLYPGDFNVYRAALARLLSKCFWLHNAKHNAECNAGCNAECNAKCKAECNAKCNAQHNAEHTASVLLVYC
jgi:hypothetical protein